MSTTSHTRASSRRCSSSAVRHPVARRRDAAGSAASGCVGRLVDAEAASHSSTTISSPRPRPRTSSWRSCCSASTLHREREARGAVPARAVRAHVVSALGTRRPSIDLRGGHRHRALGDWIHGAVSLAEAAGVRRARRDSPARRGHAGAGLYVIGLHFLRRRNSASSTASVTTRVSRGVGSCGTRIAGRRGQLTRRRRMADPIDAVGSTYDASWSARAAPARPPRCCWRARGSTCWWSSRGRGADTLSTHALMRAGVLQLARWGLLDAIEAAGTPPIETRRSLRRRRGRVRIKPRDGVDALFAPRRTLLDRCWPRRGTGAAQRSRIASALRDLRRDSTDASTASLSRRRRAQRIAAAS